MNYQLGILIYISGLKSDRVIATIYNDTDEFTVQRKQAMVYNDNGNFENFHEYWKTHGSNMPTNPITVTRIFPHWAMDQI